MAAIGAGRDRTPLLGGLAFDAHAAGGHRRLRRFIRRRHLRGRPGKGTPAAVLAGRRRTRRRAWVSGRGVAGDRFRKEGGPGRARGGSPRSPGRVGGPRRRLAVKTAQWQHRSPRLAVQTLSLGAAATAPSVRRARRRPADCPFFASQRYWLVAGAHACVFGSFKVFEQFSSAIFVQRFSYDVRTAGLMASSVPLLSAVLAPYAGKLADRASMAQRNFCTALALLVAALAVLVLCMEVSRVQLLACVGCVALGHAVLPTLLLARLRATFAARRPSASLLGLQKLARRTSPRPGPATGRRSRWRHGLLVALWRGIWAVCPVRSTNRRRLDGLEPPTARLAHARASLCQIFFLSFAGGFWWRLFLGFARLPKAAARLRRGFRLALLSGGRVGVFWKRPKPGPGFFVTLGLACCSSVALESNFVRSRALLIHNGARELHDRDPLRLFISVKTAVRPKRGAGPVVRHRKQARSGGQRARRVADTQPARAARADGRRGSTRPRQPRSGDDAGASGHNAVGRRTTS